MQFIRSLYWILDIPIERKKKNLAANPEYVRSLLYKLRYGVVFRTVYVQTHMLWGLGYGLGYRAAKGHRTSCPMKPPQYGLLVNSMLSMQSLTQIMAWIYYKEIF